MGLVVVAPERVNESASQTPWGKWREKLFICFLVVYGAGLAWFCWVKVMAFDELLSFYTAHTTSVTRLLTQQHLNPVSLDPPLVHIAAYEALHLGIHPPFAMRLPSLLGGILMVICAYIFTRRLAGHYVAALAVVIVLITDEFHLVEARPYGVLLGLSALALLLWQNVLRGRHRNASLVGLLFTFGAAISSHYFGVLLLVPFVLAEAVRMIRSRKLDPALAAVLSSSPLFALGWLSFLAGARQYKANYYTKVKASDLALAYGSTLQKLVGGHGQVGLWVLFAAILSLLAVGAWLGFRSSRTITSRSGEPALAIEWIAVYSFALLPVAGVVLARVASGAFETRYVVEFTLGTSICLASGFMALTGDRRQRDGLLIALCFLAVFLMAKRAKQDASDRKHLEHIARETALGTTVITDKQEFLYLQAYDPTDAGERHRVWIADLDREIAASGTDNIERTMLNLKQTAGLPVLSLQQLARAPYPMQVLQSELTTPSSWVPAALNATGYQLLVLKKIDQDQLFLLSRAGPPSAR